MLERLLNSVCLAQPNDKTVLGRYWRIWHRYWWRVATTQQQNWELTFRLPHCELSPNEYTWLIGDMEAFAFRYAFQNSQYHIFGISSLIELIKQGFDSRCMPQSSCTIEQAFSVKSGTHERNKVADALLRVYADSEFFLNIAFAGTATVHADWWCFCL